MVRACAAGIEGKDHGNDGRYMIRDVWLSARDSGLMPGGEIDAHRQQPDVEVSQSYHNDWEALSGSDIVKARAAAIEANGNKYDLKQMWKLLNIDARRSGLRNFTSEEYQEWRELKAYIRNIHFHAIKIQQDKAREKLTNRTRRY